VNLQGYNTAAYVTIKILMRMQAGVSDPYGGLYANLDIAINLNADLNPGFAITQKCKFYISSLSFFKSNFNIFYLLPNLK
jgi:hypothetical protein